ncbi:MAG: autotransporter outer membrane beta-barrel domain-containing protein [Granulosicoccus sp.]
MIKDGFIHLSRTLVCRLSSGSGRSIASHLSARGNHAIARLLLASLLPIGFSTGEATAQEVNPELDPGRKIFIQRTAPGATMTVQAGSIIEGIRVERLNGDGFDNPDRPDTSYALWRLEPAGIARIITPMPVAPLTRDVSVEFLEAGTVTLTAFGFDNEDAGPESNEPGFNTAVFTFNVVSSAQSGQASEEENSPETQPLSQNARTALTTLNLACSGTNASDSLSESCNTLSLQDDPAASLDRLLPEEFFAIGDALAAGADHQAKNIMSRINTVRAGQRNGFDVGSLDVTLWDQTIHGSVISASKDALWPLTGGSAAQDTFSDSPLGFFANGNISVGNVDGKGTQRNADISTNSLTLGADYRIDSDKVVGVALGITNDKSDFTADDGHMDMQGVSLNAFGTWYEKDKGYADVIAEVSENAVDLMRRINLVGQNTEFASSSTNATRLSLSIRTGRTFQRGATEFGPFAGVTITRAAIDAFSETSSLIGAGAGTALDVNSHSVTSGRFSVGGEIKRVVSTSKAVFVPLLRLELENESDTDKGVITASFSQDGDNNQMQIQGTKRDSSALLISIGSTVVFAHSQSAFLQLDIRSLDEYVNQNRVRLGYRMHF